MNLKLGTSAHRLRSAVALAVLGTALLNLAGAASPSGYSSRLWQVEDGLPHNNVEALAQTRDGYLWVGTQNGLARFDGMRFVVFGTNNLPALKDSHIRALLRTSDDSLWIGDDSGGLVCLKEGRFADVPPVAEGGWGRIYCLLETRDGSLWAGSAMGLSRYGAASPAHFTTGEGLPNNNVRALCERGNELWLATDAGVSCFRSNRFERLKLPVGVDLRYARALALDPDDCLWLGFRNGLARLKDGEVTSYTRRQGLPEENETVLHADQHSNLWIGSMGGLSRRHDSVFYSEVQADGSSYGRVRCFLEDQEGNLWVGTRDGLNQLRRKRFLTYTTSHGLAHNNVMSVTEDRHGKIWCAMWGGGIACLSGEAITNFSKEDPTPNALKTDSVLCVRVEDDGSVLVGADYEGGVVRFHHGRFDPIGPTVPGVTDQATRVIYRDRGGNLWFWLNSGLVLWNTREKWFPGRVVRCILEDRQGCLWVGTADGLFRRDGAGFQRANLGNVSLRGMVSSLYQSQDGGLWVGTESEGLLRIKDGRCTCYTTRQGLFSNQIADLIEDNSGWLWASCVKGIFRVRRQEFDRLESNPVGALRCIIYGRDEGLATVQCNDFAKPAAWKGHDGRLWFATSKGLVVTDPALSQNAERKPIPVLVEEVLADRKSLYDNARDLLAAGAHYGALPEETIEVPPGRGELELHYTGLSLAVPERVGFKYKLEGLDTAWVEAGSRRIAHYNHLPPGRYRFLVTACGSDGVWTESAASLKLALQPHFWQTWWFRLSLAAAGLLGLLFIYKVRLAMERRLNRLQLRIARDLHDEIGSNLGSIALLCQLPAPAAAATEEVAEIRRIALQTIDSLRDIVWFLDPACNNLHEIVLRMKEVARLQLSSLPFDFACQGEGRAAVPSLEFRRNLFPMFKETLHNAARHSGATRVRIEVAISQRLFRFSVRDDGRGFDPAHVRWGNGLRNLRRRAAELGGQVEILSAPGQGTTLSVSASIT